MPAGRASAGRRRPNCRVDVEDSDPSSEVRIDYTFGLIRSEAFHMSQDKSAKKKANVLSRRGEEAEVPSGWVEAGDGYALTLITSRRRTFPRGGN